MINIHEKTLQDLEFTYRFTTSKSEHCVTTTW